VKSSTCSLTAARVTVMKFVSPE
jgi:hypothetical protein